tara:strand:- start:9392 stop:9808 length:417 start_codon:yes stop_codon:yes gene_type:complete
MAAITISSPGGAQTNPTDTLLPYNNGGVFGDSMLVQSSPNKLYTSYTAGGPGVESGLLIDNAIGTYAFGDTDAQFTASRLNITSDGNFNIYSSKLILNADNDIEMNGLLTSVGAGGSAGLHLKLTINGIKYKIQLLDN